jgi:hypothetical protein
MALPVCLLQSSSGWCNRTTEIPDHLCCGISHPSLLLCDNTLSCASADHRVPVHLFQNDAMLCRPAGRIASALQGCCWAELGLEVKVTMQHDAQSSAATQLRIAFDQVGSILLCYVMSSSQSVALPLSS